MSIASRDLEVVRNCPRCGHSYPIKVSVTANSKGNAKQHTDTALALIHDHRIGVFCPRCHRFWPSALNKAFPDGLRSWMTRRYALNDTLNKVCLGAVGSIGVLGLFALIAIALGVALGEGIGASIAVVVCGGTLLLPFAILAYLSYLAVRNRPSQQEVHSYLTGATDEEIEALLVTDYFGHLFIGLIGSVKGSRANNVGHLAPERWRGPFFSWSKQLVQRINESSLKKPS